MLPSLSCRKCFSLGTLDESLGLEILILKVVRRQPKRRTWQKYSWVNWFRFIIWEIVSWYSVLPGAWINATQSVQILCSMNPVKQTELRMITFFGLWTSPFNMMTTTNGLRRLLSPPSITSSTLSLHSVYRRSRHVGTSGSSSATLSIVWLSTHAI